MFLVLIVVGTAAGVYSNNERLWSAFNEVQSHSLPYDYRLRLSMLTDYKEDLSVAAQETRDAMKDVFDNSTLDDTSKTQVDAFIQSIRDGNIKNNLMPNISSTTPNEQLIKDLFVPYIQNWGINYQAIMVNDILNHSSSELSFYHITKSFFNTFGYRNPGTQRFYNFEDDFDIGSPNLDKFANNKFDYCPTRNGVDEVYQVQGAKPSQSNDVIINPRFATSNGLHLNEELSLFDTPDNRISGYGYAYWGVTSPRSFDNIDPDPTNTTPVYTSKQWFNTVTGNNSSYKVTSLFFLKVSNKDEYFPNILGKVLLNTFNTNTSTLIKTPADDIESGLLVSNIKMQNIIFSSITVVIITVVIFIVLSYVRKEIDIQRHQVGLLKALGTRNFAMAISFTMLMGTIILMSTVVGFALSFPLQLYINKSVATFFYLPMKHIYFSTTAMVGLVILLPMLFIVAAFVQSMLKLRIEALALVYDRPKATSAKLISVLKTPFSNWPFKPRISVSFTLQSLGKLILTFFIFTFVSFLIIFETTATDIFNDKIANIYGTLDKNVKWLSTTSTMYNDESGVLDTQHPAFDWVNNNNSDPSQGEVLDPAKSAQADWFHIDSQDKLNRIGVILASDNFKDYYLGGDQVELLFKATHDDNGKFDDTKTRDFINPNPPHIVPDEIMDKLFPFIQGAFEKIEDLAKIDPTKQTDIKWPGFSIGMIIYDSMDLYPSLDFSGSPITSWSGHNIPKPLVHRFDIYGLYNAPNSTDPSKNVQWKDWYNLDEKTHKTFDPIFNDSHLNSNSSFTAITYVSSQGVEVSTDRCPIIPVAISQSLASLNKYTYDDVLLSTIRWKNYNQPALFKVQAIVKNNLDDPTIYANIDDLRIAMNMVKDPAPLIREPIANTYNYIISKSDSILPCNYVNIIQPEGKYGHEDIASNYEVGVENQQIISIIKSLMQKIFSGPQKVINITKYLTLLGLAFTLIVLVNMIIDNNIRIIAMMKSLGYRTNEVNILIIGPYIISLVLAFIIGSIMSFVVWHFVINLISLKAAILFNIPINPLTLLSSAGLMALVMGIGYFIGIYIIRFKSTVKLLQGE